MAGRIRPARGGRELVPRAQALTALRGQARARPRLAANEALQPDDFAAARSLVAIDPPLPDEAIALALKREQVARKAVRVAAVWIDAYEHPNRTGATPTVKVDWKDAVKLCESAGKRLCSEDEWQRACSRSPTPSSTACARA